MKANLSNQRLLKTKKSSQVSFGHQEQAFEQNDIPMDLGALPSLKKRVTSKTEVFSTQGTQQQNPLTLGTFVQINGSDELAMKGKPVDSSLVQLHDITEQMEKKQRQSRPLVKEQTSVRNRHDSFSPSNESSFSFKPKFFKPAGTNNNGSSNQTVEQIYSVKEMPQNNSNSVDPYQQTRTGSSTSQIVIKESGKKP